MDHSICFSHNFVNKQNVRSFSNIVKSKHLKNGSVFIKHELKDENLVRETSEVLYECFDKLRLNLKSFSKYDFKHWFQQENNIKKLNIIDKEYIFLKSIIILKDTIPKNFIGGFQNSKLFKRLVHTVIFSMNRQHIIFTKYFDGWDISVLPWVSVPPNISYEIINITVQWIMENVLSAILCLNFYVTTCKLDSEDNKLYYFKKEHWQSFYDKTISDMIYARIISKYEDVRQTGNKNIAVQSCKNLRILKKEIPKIRLILKPNNSYRPIVCYKTSQLTKADKCKFKEKLTFLKMFLGGKSISEEKFEKQYKYFYFQWVEKDRPKLYFIKTDLSNAFGTINREKLFKILYLKYLRIQKKENDLLLRKKISQSFKEILLELQKPIVFRTGTAIYKWKKGLVQGYKYSPIVSEIYYSFMDDIYFSNHIQTSIDVLKLFIRVVDDYLYITESIEDANSFLAALSNYKNVNYEKTFVNFEHQYIKFTDHITFLGNCYDTKNLQVRKSNSIYSGQMCYKINFTNAIIEPHKFIENRIGLSSIHISSHIFNLIYNNETSIWQHIYTTLCLAANKFCTMLSILLDERDIKEYFMIYKRKVTVKLCNAMIDTISRNTPNDKDFVYCINHFRFLSYKALYLFAKPTPKCSTLIPMVKCELARSNCMTGKWKEHAMYIQRNGTISHPAVREVCRRVDYKLIMRKLNNIPEGFEAYKNCFYI